MQRSASFARAVAMMAAIAAAIRSTPGNFAAQRVALDAIGPYKSRGKGRAKHHNRGGTAACKRAATSVATCCATGERIVPDERWSVVDWKPTYEVSDAGRVRNRETGHVLKPQRCSNGYRGVQLGRGTAVLVHRLVGSLFCSGWFDGAHINHKNGVRDDNRASNLEWVSPSDNHKHAHRTLPRKSTKVAIYVAGKPYASQKDAAFALGVCQGTISSALRRGHLCKGREIVRV